MDGPLTRKVADAFLQLQYLFVGLAFGQAKHLSHLVSDGALLEGDRGTKQCYVLGAISFKDVFDHTVAFLPRKVEVEVGRTAPLGIEETLKVEVQLNRIDIRDLQAIGHYAIGTATSTYMIKSLFHSEVHNIPSDEEIGAEAHFFNNLQLFFHPAIGRFVGLPVAVHHPVKSQLAQQLTVVIHITCETTLIFGSIIQINLTIIQKALGVFN